MKVGFCFLVTNEIYTLDIWEDFFLNVNKNKYGIYIHSKTSLKKYFKNCQMFTNVIKTSWGDISLVKASNFLFIKPLKIIVTI